MRRRDFISVSSLAATAAVGAPLPVTAKSCILLMMTGGVSHLDTFDPKPEAPSDVRGPFRAMRTGAPEIQISELFPKLAAQASKFSLIRSMHHAGELLHDEGMQLAQTGHATAAGVAHPHLGSVFHAWNGGRHLILPGPMGQTGGNSGHGQTAGFLGAAHQPAFLHPGRLVHGSDSRSRYGSNLFGDSCLAARMLVESGVRVVTVNMFDTVFGIDTWDMHGYSPFGSMAGYRDRVAPVFDRAASALIADLDERGLLQTTMVLGLTEFGRTPRINPTGGRDHWPHCWTTLVAGGGFAGGRVYGSSDARGAEPRDNPVTPPSLLATVYRALGVPLDPVSGIQPMEL